MSPDKDPMAAQDAQGSMEQAQVYANLAKTNEADNGDVAESEDYWGPEESPEDEQDIQFADSYVNGWEPQVGDPGYEEFRGWLDTVTPERRTQLDATKAEFQEQVQSEMDQDAQTEASLSKNAAELLEGRLPRELADRVNGPYALGVNQSDGCGTAEEAESYLIEQGGLPLLHYNPDQRFMFFDTQTTADNPEYTERALLRGYYGIPNAGRFVFAFPVTEASVDGTLPPSQAAQSPLQDKLPADFYVNVADSSDQAVNTKYCAGFIDEQGGFHPNGDFMVTSNPNLQSGDWV